MLLFLLVSSNINSFFIIIDAAKLKLLNIFRLHAAAFDLYVLYYPQLGCTHHWLPWCPLGTHDFLFCLLLGRWLFFELVGRKKVADVVWSHLFCDLVLLSSKLCQLGLLLLLYGVFDPLLGFFDFPFLLHYKRLFYLYGGLLGYLLLLYFPLRCLLIAAVHNFEALVLVIWPKYWRQLIHFSVAVQVFVFDIIVYV